MMLLDVGSIPTVSTTDTINKCIIKYSQLFNNYGVEYNYERVGNNQSIVIYENSDGDIKLDVLLQDESVWLNQEQMTILFGKARRTIGEHIQNIYSEGEVNVKSTRRNFRLVQKEGNREVTRNIDFYNLEVILSVGYRVKSVQGTKFRIF